MALSQDAYPVSEHPRRVAWRLEDVTGNGVDQPYLAHQDEGVLVCSCIYGSFELIGTPVLSAPYRVCAKC